MSNDLFDYFGGMAERPDDAAGDELDLSDLNLDDASNAGESESSQPTTGPNPPTDVNSEPNRPAPSTRAESGNRPAAGEEDELSHWLGLASTLGVAMDSTKFEKSDKPRDARREPPAKPTKTRKPKSPAIVDAEDDQWFGKGLIDHIDVEPSESRQSDALSERFEPDSSLDLDDEELDTDDEATPIYVDDFEPIVTPEDAMEQIDEDVVEFEVEELSPGRSPPPQFERSRERDRGREGERGRARGRGRDREQDREQDRQRGARPPRRNAPPVREEAPPIDREPQDVEEDFDAAPTDSATRAPEERRRRRRGRRSRSEQTTGGSGESREPRRRPPPLTDTPEDADFGDLDETVEYESVESGSDEKNVKFPTWAEAIEPLIEGNIERHRKNKGRRGGSGGSGSGGRRGR